ncbi:MAG: hypothetical protein ACJ8FG_04425, partial [Sphingomicrobium sp.]
LAAASLLALAACNQAAPEAKAAAIDGTWKADVDSVQFDQKPDEMLLQAGQYSCKSCVPAVTVPADGAFHPITAPYADSLSVKVVDDHTIVRASKKGAKPMGETKVSVSPDGNTLTGSFTDTSGSTTATGTFVETRVGAAPAGAHAISGQWKPSKLQDFNAAALTFTYKVDGDTLHSTSGTGQSYAAKFDGPDVPIKGDDAGTTAAVKKTGDNSFVETDKRGGKVVGVFNFSVDSSGVGHGVYENKEDGSKVTYTARR